ncbi:MAG: hypothetical protein ACFFBH_14475 [Promethearchaeota archaeon]
MESKYSPSIEDQTDKFLLYLNEWKELFSIKLNYYDEGWAISLREKNVYPRYIVLFKPYGLEKYSLKSFEIHFDESDNETFNEIYFNKDIGNSDEVINEIKEIIYGKDIIDKILRDIHE